MQNKANLQKAQISISLYEQKDYEDNLRRWLCENKAKQSQYRNGSKLVMQIKTRGAVKS